MNARFPSKSKAEDSTVGLEHNPGRAARVRNRHYDLTRHPPSVRLWSTQLTEETEVAGAVALSAEGNEGNKTFNDPIVQSVASYKVGRNGRNVPRSARVGPYRLRNSSN